MIESSEVIKKRYEKYAIAFINKHETLVNLLDEKYNCYVAEYNPDVYNKFNITFYPKNIAAYPKVSMNFQFSDDYRVLWPDYATMLSLL